ncbi:MAG: PAS domain-containing protein [Nitrosomonas sp.]
MVYINRSKPQLLEEIQRLYTELAAIKLMTEKRTTELYISEERFSLAMRGANDGLWDWNLETDEVYYSPRWRSMLGYAENELDNNLNTWANLVHPDDKNRVLEKVQDYLAGRADSFEVEMRMHHKDGHEVYVLSRAFLVTREV